MKHFIKVFSVVAFVLASGVTYSVAMAGGYGHSDYYGDVKVHVGHWRTQNHRNGHYDKYEYTSWEECWSYCKDDHSCTGVEYLTKTQRSKHDPHPYSHCEIHYDEFKYCDKKSGHKKHKGSISTCWVKSNVR